MLVIVARPCVGNSSPALCLRCGEQVTEEQDCVVLGRRPSIVVGLWSPAYEGL